MGGDSVPVRAELVEASLMLALRAFTTRPGLAAAGELVDTAGFDWVPEPGVARRPVTFLCFAKEKSPKERRPAVWVPALRFGQSALLDSGGGPQNSLRSNNCGPDPASICAARPSQDGWGAGTEYQDKENQYNQGRAMARPCGLWPSAFLTFQTPSVCAEERSFRRKKGRALSEPKASLRGPRLKRAPQVARSEAQDADSRVAFSLLTFFWRSKRK